jgi:outer membrane protein TolC
MRVAIVILSLAVVSATVSDGAHADTAAQRLSLAEAEALALDQNTALDIGASAINAAEERVAAARASRLPRVSVDANALFWDTEIAFPLAVPDPMDPMQLIEQTITVRGRVTAAATLTVAQPITPQIALSHVVALERAGLAATRGELRQTRVTVASRAAEGYILVLLARAGGDIAALRAEQLAAQLERARALVEGGVLQPVDVMRLEAAQAAATQEVIRSRSQGTQAAAALALILGMPAGRSVEVVDALPAEPGPPATTLEQATKLALSNRPDLDVVGHRIAQAESGAAAAKAQLYPNLVAIGSLQHNEGGGAFAVKNSWFVGLNLQWDLWDWGQRRHGYKEAQAQAEQVRLGSRQLADAVRLEVESAVEDASASYQALAVARTGLKVAEEAFRIQTAQYEEGVTTTTELLTAQTEVTQARLGYATARYAYFRALVNLARATGQMPTEVLARI